MEIRSFKLNQLEIDILEREAKKTGKSKSEIIRGLIRNQLMNIEEKELIEVQKVLEKILEIYKEQREDIKEILEILKERI